MGKEVGFSALDLCPLYIWRFFVKVSFRSRNSVAETRIKMVDFGHILWTKLLFKELLACNLNGKSHTVDIFPALRPNGWGDENGPGYASTKGRNGSTSGCVHSSSRFRVERCTNLQSTQEKQWSSNFLGATFSALFRLMLFKPPSHTVRWCRWLWHTRGTARGHYLVTTRDSREACEFHNACFS